MPDSQHPINLTKINGENDKIYVIFIKTIFLAKTPEHLYLYFLEESIEEKINIVKNT